eukprot:m.172013 g.172013  ORF g.172013 m.172013 type:complete len:346 (+) comp17850_c0_seq1:1171-2208(+)
MGLLTCRSYMMCSLLLLSLWSEPLCLASQSLRAVRQPDENLKSSLGQRFVQIPGCSLLHLPALFSGRASEREEREEGEGERREARGVCPDRLRMASDDKPFETAVASVVLPGVTTNTMSIAFDPNRELYYSGQAGSNSYALWTFDKDGQKVNSMKTTGFDGRGMWWNSADNQLQANCYSSGGYVAIKLDDAGMCKSSESIVKGQRQPEADSVLAFDPDNNELLGYRDGKIFRYNPTTGEEISTTELSSQPPALNPTFCGYTGVPGHEIVLFSGDNLTCHYVDKFSGQLAEAKTKLALEERVHNKFNTGYANGKLFVVPSRGNAFRGFQIVSEALAACSFGALPPK